MNSFGDQTGQMFAYVRVISSIMSTSFILISLLVILFLFIRKNDLSVGVWKLLHLIRADALFKGYASYQYSQYMGLLIRRSVSTRRSLELMASIKGKPMMKFLARRINEGLEAGKEMADALKDSFLDEKFSSVCCLGLLTDSFEDALNTYDQLYEKRLKRNIRRCALFIQCIAYAGIGMVIVMIYSAMLMPMSALDAL